MHSEVVYNSKMIYEKNHGCGLFVAVAFRNVLEASLLINISQFVDNICGVSFFFAHLNALK